MAVVNDLSGKRFGRLVVLNREFTGSHRTFWKCRCDCGNEKTTDGVSLKDGRCQSCGCLAREMVSARSKTHGLSKSKFYRVWRGMLNRCLNHNQKCYPRYGGRGIKIDERWLKFENFRDDMLPSYQEGLMLERRDNEKNYSKDNCEWATQLVQANNTRTNKFIETPWGRMTVAAAARKSGLKYGALESRVNAGWPFEKLFIPSRGPRNG